MSEQKTASAEDFTAKDRRVVFRPVSGPAEIMMIPFGHRALVGALGGEPTLGWHWTDGLCPCPECSRPTKRMRVLWLKDATGHPPHCISPRDSSVICGPLLVVAVNASLTEHQAAVAAGTLDLYAEFTAPWTCS